MASSSVPRWLAKMLVNWHRSKATKLLASAEEQRKAVDRVSERATYHEHRVKHWDLIANRRGKAK